MPRVLDKTDSHLSDSIERAVEEWRLPGLAVGVVREGSVSFQKCLGRTGTPGGREIDDRTLFYFASCGKAVTATLAAMLVQEHLIAWDEPIIRHLPRFRVADREVTEQVTFRDLLCHRAGFKGSNLIEYAALPGNLVLERANWLEQERPLRDGFVYSNSGYTIVGLALAHITGLPLSGLVEDRIIRRFGLEDATTSVPTVTTRARPHMLHQGVMRESTPPVIPSGGAGPIWISLRDAIAWLQLQLSVYAPEKSGSPERYIAQLHTPQIRLQSCSGVVPWTDLSYGMGWYVQEYFGRSIIYHSGACFGYESFVLLSPEDEFGCVVLLNGAGGAREIVAFSALDYYADVNGPDWSRVLSARWKERAVEHETQLAEFASFDEGEEFTSIELLVGRYESQLNGSAIVQLVDGKPCVTFEYVSPSTYAMIHLSGTRFALPTFRLPFLRDDYGLTAQLSFKIVGNYVKELRVFGLGVFRSD